MSYTILGLGQVKLLDQDRTQNFIRKSSIAGIILQLFLMALIRYISTVDFCCVANVIWKILRHVLSSAEETLKKSTLSLAVETFI